MSVGGWKRRDANGVRSRMPQDVWAELYTQHYSWVQRYFARRVPSGQDADDLAQQVFVGLARRPVPRDARTYIAAIARNALSQYRRTRAKDLAGLRKLLDELAERDESMHEAAYRDILEALAAALTPRQLDLVRLRFAENLDIRESADRLECSRPAVCKRLHRIRRRAMQIRDHLRAVHTLSSRGNDRGSNVSARGSAAKHGGEIASPASARAGLLRSSQ